MNKKDQFFTLGQANAIVSAIRPLVSEIFEIRTRIIAQQEQLWPVVSKAAGNGGSLAASEVASEFARLDILVREIAATGAILRDINTGLVDFLALRKERQVYLCWQYGELQVAYWHELDGGFSGRRLIDAEF